MTGKVNPRRTDWVDRTLARMSRTGLILFLLLGLQSAVRAEGPDSGIRIDFPTSELLPYDKFGVFIGIDRYSKLPAENQLYGCVADATGMKEAFVRLGVLPVMSGGHRRPGHAPGNRAGAERTG